ncbi:hypothetical protein Verru16b_00953 [Lacunisphaera limnophila]|uniref:DUF4440 domain-containing protein n=1 Tax=Lacunisphaera limnophila TaxID=1838286 RepID=A0A1D8ASM0_9BACT|nr:nuclear transport factor 2 family protein [Lacunisphaera limnophila]AOS43895.1 hypothetical protein Verru16b_00953 [Lacunisphaera limnophila]
MRSITLPKLFLFGLALAAGLFARASEAEVLAAVRAADDARIAATLAVDATRLDAILSDELHYAHSSGVIDSKASLLESLTSRRVVYESVEHVARDFVAAGPGLVLMRGRMLVRVGSATQRNLIDLNYLAVWREEGGRWRFLAWQSSRNPAPAKP